MNSRQRAKLRSEAHILSPIIQIGKNGVTDKTIKVVNEAFNNNNLIKIVAIKSCLDNKNDIAIFLSKETKSEIVQVIGSKIILYKKKEKRKKC